MKLTNIDSIKYFPVLNKVNTWNSRGRIFLDTDRLELFRKCLDTFFEEIIPSKKGDGIQLGYFYANYYALRKFIETPIIGFTLLIFPSKGEIKKYILNPEEEFFTSIHNNPDPLIISDIKTKLYLHPKKDENFLYVADRKSVPNRIFGAILFKHNPLENKNLYSGFEEFLNSKLEN